MWNITTKEFSGRNGTVNKSVIAEVEWLRGGEGKMQMKELPGSIRSTDADLVLLSMGFVHPVHDGLLDLLELEYSDRGTIRVTANNQTSRSGVFATGDSVNGASLVVTAIMSGRKAALSIMEYLEREVNGK